MKIITPTNALKDFFNLIKKVVSDSQPLKFLVQKIMQKVLL